MRRASAIGRRGRVDTVFVLMVFCAFAISVLAVLIMSAQAYQSMNDISNYGRDERVVMSYIRTKIRNTDTAGSVYAGYFYGYSALVLREEFYGYEFVTYIFYYDGWVRELFHEPGGVFSPENGIPIIRVEYLNFETQPGGLIRVSTGRSSMLILPRSTTESGGH